VLAKWGHGASVRIPAAVMDAAGLSLDQTVDVRADGGCVIVEPVREPAFSLAELLAAVADESIHSEIDFGCAVGRELL
jgi:antitoxin MazE